MTFFTEETPTPSVSVFFSSIVKAGNMFRLDRAPKLRILISAATQCRPAQIDLHSPILESRSREAAFWGDDRIARILNGVGCIIATGVSGNHSS